MPVYKQPNSKNWLIEFKVDGKRYRRSSGTNIRRKALRLEEKWRQEIHDGKHRMGKIKALTIEEAADRYFETVIRPNQSREKSKIAEKCSLIVIVRYFSSDTRLDNIRSADIARWRDQMLSDGYAPATVNRYMATLRAVMNRAISEWDAVNTMPKFHLLPLRNNRCRYLSVEEERKIIAAIEPYLKDLIIFLIDTGARLSEALDLTWNQVDLHGDNRASVMLMKTKNGHPRRIPLTIRITNILKELKVTNDDMNEFVFVYLAPGKSKAAPFGNPFGAWKRALKRAGVDQTFRIHDLRHTFASRLVSSGVPIFDVSKLLGHMSITMTMRYAHLSPTAFEGAISKLEQSFEFAEPQWSGEIIDLKLKQADREAR